MEENDIINDYRQRLATAHQEADKYKKLANKYSLLRLVVFASVILAVYFGIKYDDFTIFAMGITVLVFVFIWLVSRQSSFDRQKRYFIDLAEVNKNELDSIANQTNIYNNGHQFNNEKHYYSADLDIFGNASLFQLINRSSTFYGTQKLSGWLDAPSEKELILLRQNAINELAKKK